VAHRGMPLARAHELHDEAGQWLRHYEWLPPEP
jgi:hypothetical protein